MSLVLVEDHGPVRHIVLNRPETRNAFHHELLAETIAALRAAGDDPAVRCVVWRGAGKVFSAGIDLATLQGLAQNPQTLFGFRRSWVEMGTVIEQMPKPVIAQLHGAALGGALEASLACDLRVATTDTTLRFMETYHGVVPDGGGCARLPALIGLGRAKEMIMASRPVSGLRAEAIGLVNYAVPPEELDASVTALVADLLECKRVAVGLAKQVLDHAARPNLSVALDEELLAQQACMASDDFRALAGERRPIASH
ncbi:hypothetical protein BST36_23425 [Mycolicibacterium moriokaense]|uniref:Enoyl-CoA hydratase n=1 Tax=Mycolicibacterium moriokaense TaxID=39691 RepID=A0AAD1H746_9MYCO|nr:enoyl-CoA hydratase/isomerase family protein [Mycolicibacterium moriokaense]MCV7039169.1 enoyl-CoA hydratase/isomerase family protein [Mycolicibacterium moriokaense]ORB18547.1 hypothetical protein BST36_23425 [Mycolicibacterium moriokaense]BBX00073.1 enoyl-CoA hydratase [Mycolicibacterium moriokaense]